MPAYTSEDLTDDINRSEAHADSMQEWWESAHRRDHEYWLSGTPGREIWERLGVRDRLNTGISVLNIGIGLGRCTRDLVDLGCAVSVLDVTPVALERVADVAKGWTNAAELPVSHFDLALSHLVAQHMPDFDFQDQIRYVLRALRPDGLFAFQYATGVDGQCSPQFRNYAKSGAIRRRPQDIVNVVSLCGGRVVNQFQRETHPCGTVWWVAHVVHAQSNCS